MPCLELEGLLAAQPGQHKQISFLHVNWLIGQVIVCTWNRNGSLGVYTLDFFTAYQTMDYNLVEEITISVKGLLKQNSTISSLEYV